MRKLLDTIHLALMGCSSTPSATPTTSPPATAAATTTTATTTPAATTTTIAKASRQAALAVQKCIDAISTGMFADVLSFQDHTKLDTFETACKAAQTELSVDSGAQLGQTPINKLQVYLSDRLVDVAKFRFAALDGAIPATYPVVADLFQWRDDLKALLDAAR